MIANTLSGLITNLPDGMGIRFVSPAGETVRPYPGLRRRARGILAGLRRRGIRPGGEVLIEIESPEEFILVFWACLLGRLIPVPVQAAHNDEHRLKLLKIWSLLGDPHLVTDRRDSAALDAVAARHGLGARAAAISGRASRIEELVSADDGFGGIEEPSPGDIACIQFSSGSTGDPKGVVLTHEGVLSHLREFAASARMDAGDRFLSWFPLTHDMGLIGWHLLPLFCGASQCLMPTSQFVWRPSVWLAKASEHRATVLSTNNFGLKHFLKLLKPGTAAGWDLSAVRLLFNGAEPISATLCDDFFRALAGCGLKQSAMFPGYGLAEATLAVSFAEPGEEMRTHQADRRFLRPGDQIQQPERPRDSVTFVDLGRPISGTEVRIVDGEGAPLGERRVGAVEILSAGMTRGYYRNPDATARLFAADGWLRTGDLGFLESGRLTIMGRMKEMIIQGGHNYYPQDIERVAEEVPGIELGKVVACGVPDGQRQRELLVLFVYYRKDLERFAELSRSLSGHLLRQAGWLVDSVVPVPAIPKTTSGKIRRFKLAEQFQEGAFDQVLESLREIETRLEAGTPKEPRRGLVPMLHAQAARILGTEHPDHTRSLFEQGLTSVQAVELQTCIEREMGIRLPVTVVFDYPSIDQLAEFLSGGKARKNRESKRSPESLAIIGMSCRFPGGADTPEAFWDLLAAGRDALGPLPQNRVGAVMPSRPVPLGGFLADVAGFDNGFFGISPREAESLDPQARLLLEASWEALERAGLDVPSLAGVEAGVFVGIGNADYALAHFHSGALERLDAYSYTGISPAVTAGRIAYLLGFEGPAMAVDTSCSSSLVAVHLAAQSLLAGDCEMALAAGVNLILSPEGHASLSLTGALSREGRSKAFDDSADGYVRGEGCGVVVLKRLRDAREAGDPILAVIRGTAVNHDGRSGGLTVPNGPAQTRVIRRALERSGVAPEAIGYVEAHGTGTPLGDPIELQALQAVFAGRREKLWIGSVKTNLGHLESAAGMASLIKVVLSLMQGAIPPSLNVTQLNRRVDWEQLALRVAREETPWERGILPRLAGVSSFGFSGTNAHVIVEEAPARGSREDHGEERRPLLLPLSAHSPEALRAVAGKWKSHLEAHPELDLQDVCYTAAVCRGSLPCRAVCRFTSREEMLALLDELAGHVTPGGRRAGLSTGRLRKDVSRKLAFVYSGQGSQWAGMGRELLEREPVFAAEMKRCDESIRRIAGWSVIEEALRPEPESRLQRTDVAQAGIFAIQVALTSLLAHYGIAPDAVAGHSIGEVAAFRASGILNFEDAVRVITARGRLMQRGAGLGRMAMVRLPAAEVAAMLNGRLEIAAINGPRSTVVTGSPDAVSEMVTGLKTRRIPCIPLPVDFAFHSAQMDAASSELAAALEGVGSAPAHTPLYSTVTAKKLTDDPDPAYWQRNVRQPVRFREALEEMARDGCTHFLEIGPHAVLTPAMLECLDAGASEDPVIPTLRRGKDSCAALLDALGALYVRGYDPDWKRLYRGGDLVDLPTYPWQRKRFWKEGFHPWSREASPSPMADLCFDLEWSPAPLPGSGQAAQRPSVAVSGDAGFTRAVQEKLGECGIECHVVAGVLDIARMIQRDVAGRLWIVTHGTQTVETGDAVHDFRRNGVWALGRVILNEHPELRPVSVDLSASPQDAEIERAAALIQSGNPAAAGIALRGEVVYAARLVRTGGLAPARKLRVEAGRSYLITGGYGSLGLLLARFLVERGARNLLLLGRHGPSQPAGTVIDSLRAQGIRVEVRRADVAEAGDLSRVLAQMNSEMPPLAGVMHAAGVLEDASLLHLDEHQLARVAAPKTEGAWNLHELTKDSRLDFFILVSSAAVLLGSPGQGAYVAANAALDGLAAERSRLGFPSLSLRLGAVGGSRMRASVAGRDLEAEGIADLREADILGALEPLWNAGRPHATLMRFDPNRWVDRHPSAANRAFLSRFLTEEAAPPPARTFTAAEVQPELIRIVAEVIGAATEDLDLTTPLRELGVDSIMTMQIRNEIARRFGREVSVASFWTYPNVSSFAAYLTSELGLTAEAQLVAATASPANHIALELRKKWEKYL